MPTTLASILTAHRSRPEEIIETVRTAYSRIIAHNDPAVFITLREEAEAIDDARRVAASSPTDLPLYGVPVAIKDNIDVAGVPTTAACPAFAYKAERDAVCVARLRRAGAIVIGKTNLDQFATGLVGVRSPYGIPRNSVRGDLLPGGSSSGSAIAVASGLVPVALGTDTAGSGRVPAMLNNIVGLKPSLGLVSTRGVVPACRTLDCVSVFSLTVDDAWTVLSVIFGFDPEDPYSRRLALGRTGRMPPAVNIGIPRAIDRVFFGSPEAEFAYESALSRLASLGAKLIEIDIVPFYETARLLYEGPWIAERFAAIEPVLSAAPDSLHPTVREIISAGARPSAVDTFKAFYRLHELRRIAERTFERIDALALPTAPRVYTTAEVLENPIELNNRLGVYTNFVNLLDLAALAVPASISDDGSPFGITLIAPAGKDAVIASIGKYFHADSQLTLGALGTMQPVPVETSIAASCDEVLIAVVGAHLSGMPLNRELTCLGGRFVEATETAADYRLFLLAGTQPLKPGLLRVGTGKGAAISVEVWTLPAQSFGRFVAAIPPPLTIGTLTLSGGRAVKGFLAEAEAVAKAPDISHFGGWRAYVRQTHPAWSSKQV